VEKALQSETYHDWRAKAMKPCSSWSKRKKRLDKHVPACIKKSKKKAISETDCINKFWLQVFDG
jgi:hypothetical protein